MAPGDTVALPRWKTILVPVRCVARPSGLAPNGARIAIQPMTRNVTLAAPDSSTPICSRDVADRPTARSIARPAGLAGESRAGNSSSVKRTRRKKAARMVATQTVSRMRNPARAR